MKKIKIYLSFIISLGAFLIHPKINTENENYASNAHCFVMNGFKGNNNFYTDHVVVYNNEADKEFILIALKLWRLENFSEDPGEYQLARPLLYERLQKIGAKIIPLDQFKQQNSSIKIEQLTIDENVYVHFSPLNLGNKKELQELNKEMDSPLYKEFYKKKKNVYSIAPEDNSDSIQQEDIQQSSKNQKNEIVKTLSFMQLYKNPIAIITASVVGAACLLYVGFQWYKNKKVEKQKKENLVSEEKNK